MNEYESSAQFIIFSYVIAVIAVQSLRMYFSKWKKIEFYVIKFFDLKDLSATEIN